MTDLSGIYPSRKNLTYTKKLGTWTLVEPPKDANIVRNHLILCYKCDATVAIASHKTRFITQGFLQAMGIDYNKTFVPTAKLSAI